MTPTKDSKNLFLKSTWECLTCLFKTGLSWLLGQSFLFEAFLVALSLHVLAVPVLWVMGWALPWPKGATVTTVIEYDLRNWPDIVKSKKVLEFRDPRLNR